MRLLILAAALAVPVAILAAPPRDAPTVRAPALATSPAGKECRRPDIVYARTPLRPQARSLGEMPPGDLMLAVYNQVDGCMEPVVVRYGVGGGRR